MNNRTRSFRTNHFGLFSELFHGGKPPTLQRIIERIPTEKQVLILLDDATKT